MDTKERSHSEGDVLGLDRGSNNEYVFTTSHAFLTHIAAHRSVEGYFFVLTTSNGCHLATHLNTRAFNATTS
jgi:hypothetical protein